MKFSFLTSFFSKKNKKLTVPDSILVKKLKSLSKHNNLLIFENSKIYHHTQVYNIPLMIIDKLRGIYIFEIKEWSYDDLKNSNAQKAQHQNSSKDTLAFQNTHDIIRKKFNELTHNDGVPIFNFLLMENLNTDDYEHLNDSLQELLPSNKVIFSDSLTSDILKKLQSVSQENHNLPPLNEVVGSLLIQYSILDESNIVHICNNEQINFLDSELLNITALNGLSKSGKSNLLLLKSIIEIINKQAKKIVIIKPTLLSCEILKKKLLDIIEHAIIEIDLTCIEVLTPLELLNKHQEKLNKEPLTSISEINSKHLKKKFYIADIIMCDDSNLYIDQFIQYLKHLQKNSKLLLVNSKHYDVSYNLDKSFHKNNREIIFTKTNQHAKSLHIISNLLKDCNAKDIIVIGNSLSLEKLNDDLKYFIKDEAILLDSSKHLIEQDLDKLLLATYTDINSINVKHSIMMDTSYANEDELEYALNLAKKYTYVLYEEDCQSIKKLKEKYESNKK